MKKIIKQNDFKLIALLLLIASILFLSSQLINQEGNRVNIIVDGDSFDTYPLHSSHEVSIEDLRAGKLIIKIESGFVWVTHSTCPDRLCVKHRKINKTGESIICLPNRVAIEITGDRPDSNIPDAITR
jgi:hypothetical protein